METEIIKKEQSHDVSIALIQKDVEYIKNSITKIDTAIAVFDRNFARKEEMSTLVKTMQEITTKLDSKADHLDMQKFQNALDLKVNNTDFDPIKKTLTKINWMLIAAIVGALLVLVIKGG